MFPLSDRRKFGVGGPVPESVGPMFAETSSLRLDNVGPDDDVSPDKKRKQNKRKPVYVRKEFPETWLWTEEMVK